MTLSRRAFVCSAVATAAAVMAPPIPIAATDAAAAPAKLFWAAGTPGEMDAHWYQAETAELAKSYWLDENHGDCGCEAVSAEDGVCDRCSAAVDAWPLDVSDPAKGMTPADWLRSDLGYNCSRCSYPAFAQESAQAVGDEAVCSDCMTLADWDIVDPERAAELREDADGYSQ